MIFSKCRKIQKKYKLNTPIIMNFKNFSKNLLRPCLDILQIWVNNSKKKHKKRKKKKKNKVKNNNKWILK